MRVVGGRLKGRRLTPPKGMRTRPTSDRTREAVFNILESRFPGRLQDAYVADFFAGTGALGIEALSRGAAHAVFADTDAGAIATIRENVAALGLEGRATILRLDATRLKPGLGPFDIVFLDPPYGGQAADQCLAAITRYNCIKVNAVIVVEIGSSDSLSAPTGLETFLIKRYKTSIIIFFFKRE